MRHARPVFSLINLLLYLTYLIIGIIEFLILLRVILKLFGANSATPFVNWIYDTTSPLLAPFSGIFPSVRIGDSFILEVSSLVALLIYALIGYLIESFIVWIDRSLHDHDNEL